MKRIPAGDLIYYQFSIWESLRHGIFTRHGGVSPAPWASLNMGGSVGDDPAHVRENHERMFAPLGLHGERACTVWQIHSAETVIATGPVEGRRWLAQADGIVTDQPDTPLTMRFADCTPILFHDPVQGVIGMAHAGWRGTVQGAGMSVVHTMTDHFGCKPENIQAGIGPCIGPERYQVGEEVVQAVHDHFGTLEELIRRQPEDGTAYFDLWAANALDLRRNGVEVIEIAGICTAEHADEFFSHRAEQGRTGRFGAVISL